MQEKSVTLTPNKRLAKHLQKQFCIELTKQNKTAWLNKKILPLTTWLTMLWQESQDNRVLINQSQEVLLWQKVISENLGDTFVSLTDLAINYHELINGWQIKEKSKLFQDVYEKFLLYCKEKNLITISELPNLLIPYLANYKLETITFAGFDEYSPRLQIFIDALEKTGCKTSRFDPNNQISTRKRLSFMSVKDEIVACATWAKNILKNNPNATIGCVVPNLITLRTNVSQIFSEILQDPKSINISAGIPLNTLPIINSALDFLALNNNSNSEALKKFLLSPYTFNAETEKSKRALFASQFTSNNIKQLINKESHNKLSIIQTLKNWEDFITTVQNKNLCGSEWAKIFTQILQILGWPGENNLNALESRAIQHFIKILHEIAATNIVIDTMSYQHALKMLHSLLNVTLQPEPEIDAPINIVGALEAIGINVNYLWVMGLDEEHWPQTPSPNPFISLATQKKLSLPHSSAERESHFCETLITRYKRSAREVIFSHVKQIDDRIIGPSYLIADIPEITGEDLNLKKPLFLSQKIYQSQKLETLENNLAPKLATNEITHAPSRLIELQSLCPFKAFMEFRLLTKEPKKESFGISKINRGILIHSILEKFWSQIKTQQNLCSLPSDQLQKILQNKIKLALNQLSLPPELYKLEKQCLTSLLTHWLAIEKTRPPFQVIATEKSVQINLSSIPIKLRIDRIDQLGDNKNLLIDYKTGKNLPSIFDLIGERPKNPQMLLYSLAINSIEGLALAHINNESIKFKEISLEELIFGLRYNDSNNNLKTWDELIKYWENILNKIASDFCSGQAAPDPISPQVCKQCSFNLACRIQSKAIHQP